jgi:hypothetical protein
MTIYFLLDEFAFEIKKKDDYLIEYLLLKKLLNFDANHKTMMITLDRIA